MSDLIDHKEALKSAVLDKDSSNLARCYIDLISRINGINKPFICGESTDKSPSGMPNIILVCPTMGADGMAVYKLASDYSAPTY